VLSEKDAATAQFVLESGLTKAQLLEEAPIKVHPGANKKHFNLGGTSYVGRVDSDATN
jgi:hypothetical protein